MAILTFNDDDIVEVDETPDGLATHYTFVCPFGGKIELENTEEQDMSKTVTLENVRCADCCRMLDNDSDVLLTLEPQGLCAYM